MERKRLSYFWNVPLGPQWKPRLSTFIDLLVECSTDTRKASGSEHSDEEKHWRVKYLGGALSTDLKK